MRKTRRESFLQQRIRNFFQTVDQNENSVDDDDRDGHEYYNNSKDSTNALAPSQSLDSYVSYDSDRPMAPLEASPRRRHSMASAFVPTTPQDDDEDLLKLLQQSPSRAYQYFVSHRRLSSGSYCTCRRRSASVTVSPSSLYTPKEQRQQPGRAYSFGGLLESRPNLVQRHTFPTIYENVCLNTKVFEDDDDDEDVEYEDNHKDTHNKSSPYTPSTSPRRRPADFYYPSPTSPKVVATSPEARLRARVHAVKQPATVFFHQDFSFDKCGRPWAAHPWTAHPSWHRFMRVQYKLSGLEDTWKTQRVSFLQAFRRDRLQQRASSRRMSNPF